MDRLTHGQLVARTSTEVPEHLDAAEIVPTAENDMAIQGDVMIVPVGVLDQVVLDVRHPDFRLTSDVNAKMCRNLADRADDGDTPEQVWEDCYGHGVNVVEGDAIRNQHRLTTGTVAGARFTRSPPERAARIGLLGVLAIAAEARCELVHTGEHGPWSFGPGVYAVIGQMDPQTKQRAAD